MKLSTGRSIIIIIIILVIVKLTEAWPLSLDQKQKRSRLHLFKKCKK